MSDRGKASFVTMDFSDGVMKNVEEYNVHTPSDIGSPLECKELDDSLVVEKGAKGDFSSFASRQLAKRHGIAGATVGGIMGTAAGAGQADENGQLIKENMGRRALIGAGAGAVTGGALAGGLGARAGKNMGKAFEELEKGKKGSLMKVRDLGKRAQFQEYAAPLAAIVGGAAGGGGVAKYDMDKNKKNKGFNELDDSLVVKGILDKVGTTGKLAGIGTVGGGIAGGALGAGFAEPGERKKAALRGAADGALAGGIVGAGGGSAATSKVKQAERAISDATKEKDNLKRLSHLADSTKKFQSAQKIEDRTMAASSVAAGAGGLAASGAYKRKDTETKGISGEDLNKCFED